MNTPSPKVKSNSLKQNPLYIKFLNWKGDKYTVDTVIENLITQFEDDFSKNTIKNKNIDDIFLDNLTEFQKKFKGYLSEAITSKNISDTFLFFLNNAYKYIEEDFKTYLNDEIRKIKIKDEKGRWFEAIICYNFIMAFNYFGLEIIKICPICLSFFSHKGKYAKYCSDTCKEKGMKK